MRPVLAIAVCLLSGCAASAVRPVAVIGSDGGARIPLVWHEVQDPHATCRAFLKINARARGVTAGCSGWRGGEFHIITGIVQQEHHFCVVGHEVGHAKLGLFHDNRGKWIVNR